MTDRESLFASTASMRVLCEAALASDGGTGGKAAAREERGSSEAVASPMRVTAPPSDASAGSREGDS